MYWIPALLWYHQNGSQDDVIQREEKTLEVNIGALIKEEAYPQLERNKIQKITKFTSLFILWKNLGSRLLRKKQKQNSPEWAEGGSKGSLQRPEEQREMKRKAYSRMRFTLSYRITQRKTLRYDDHTKKLVI